MTNRALIKEMILIFERSAAEYESGKIGWWRGALGKTEDYGRRYIHDSEDLLHPGVFNLCASGMLMRESRKMAKDGEIRGSSVDDLGEAIKEEFMYSVHQLFPDPFGQEGQDDEGEETIECWNDDFAGGKSDVIAVCRAAAEQLRQQENEG